jgi:hypothetical protein
VSRVVAIVGAATFAGLVVAYALSVGPLRAHEHRHPAAPVTGVLFILAAPPDHGRCSRALLPVGPFGAQPLHGSLAALSGC